MGYEWLHLSVTKPTIEAAHYKNIYLLADCYDYMCTECISFQKHFSAILDSLVQIPCH